MTVTFNLTPQAGGTGTGTVIWTSSPGGTYWAAPVLLVTPQQVLFPGG